MISALVGPTINHQPGDIVETDEAARWIEFGIAEAVTDIVNFDADISKFAADLEKTMRLNAKAMKANAAAMVAIETAEGPITKEVTARLRAKSPRVTK